MKCERCGTDGHVELYEVDEYAGYLCDDCREVWNEIVSEA